MSELTTNQHLKLLTKHLIQQLQVGGIETTDLIYYNNRKQDLLLKQRLNNQTEYLKD